MSTTNRIRLETTHQSCILTDATGTAMSSADSSLVAVFKDGKKTRLLLRLVESSVARSPNTLDKRCESSRIACSSAARLCFDYTNQSSTRVASSGMGLPMIRYCCRYCVLNH